jgi:hypothetical protein
MRHLKEILFSLLAVVSLCVVFGLAQGCSKPDDNNNPPIDTTTPPDTTEGTRPDSTGPGTITFSGALNTITNGLPLGLAKKGDYLYVADGYRISTVNVANPALPSVLAQFPSSGSTLIYGITVSGDLLYAVFGSKLKIFDITSPVSPIELSSLSLSSGDSRGIAVLGDYAYIGRKGLGISIVDISSATAPVELLRLSDYPTNCAQIGAGRLYVGKEYGVGNPTNQRIWKLGLDEPDTLIPLDFADPAGYSAFDLDYIYGHLFVASGLSSAYATTGTFNIVSKSELDIVYSDTTHFLCQAISVEGNFVYLVDRDQSSGGSNLYIYFAYTPQAAFRVRAQTISSPAKDIFVSDGNIYILCTNRLLIYKHNY